jgi:membrane protein DedA with SNARE-associated domain
MKALFQKIKVPILVCAFFGVVFLLWRLFNLPSEDELVSLARNYFQHYGVVTVFFAAIIEGALFAGWYAPGGLVIFLGVILSRSPLQAVASVVATILGFIIAYTLNFFIGKYGWYKALFKLGVRKSLEKASTSFEKYGFRAIYLSYWEPNLASLISTAAGIAKAPFKKFFIVSGIATIFWAIFWGSITYICGQKILNYLGIIFFIVMLGWVVWIIIRHVREQKTLKNCATISTYDQ